MREILRDSKTKAKTYVARSEFILHRGWITTCKMSALMCSLLWLRTIAVYDAVFYCIAIMFFSDSQLDGQLFSRGNSSYCFIVKNAGLPCING